MSYSFYDFIILLGALGLFIYGMKVMSEGIQKVAGSKMRQILSAMTSNRFKGILTGFILTGLVQSSSATTVMVVSFVNAGLLTLMESIGVIMGANIGTTITAWLISLIGFKVKLSSAALPIVALGFPLLFTKSSKLRAWGEVLIGFAILFIGLGELKNSVPDLGSNPEILTFLATFTEMGYVSYIVFVIIGTIITILVQSSSAAMALTLVMANNGWIPFELAAAMVLGENIGTTITANIAATIGNVAAKRAARAHLIFNIIGVTWMLLVIPFFLKGIDSYMLWVRGISPMDSNHPEAIPIALSLFHTSFNVLNTLFLVGFAPRIAKFVTKLVPMRGEEEHHLEFIGTEIIRTPDISILEAKREISKMAKVTRKMSRMSNGILNKKKNKKIVEYLENISNYEQITDRMELEIAIYLSKIAEGNLSKGSSNKIRGLLSVNNDLERVGDLFYQISLSIQRKNENELKFSEYQIEQLNTMFGLIEEAFDIMLVNLKVDYKEMSDVNAIQKEKEIDVLRNDLRRSHLNNIQSGNYDLPSGLIYSDIFLTMERIGDHIYNVTEALVNET